ncbi:Holliday junction branch migration protein RuvA [Bdellovibrionota bacterium FG-1]
MIGYLSGKILEHTPGRVLVGVGASEQNGIVGYTVMVPESGGHVGLLPGNTVEFFIHTHVREDALDLYGFRTAAEKDLFLTLLEVNGIGPKMSLTILTGAEPGALVRAITGGDKVFLSHIPGIGKKTAERMVLELGDKIRKKIDTGIYAAFASTKNTMATGATAAGPVSYAVPALVRDAASALISLGYREQDALQTLQKVVNEADDPPQKVEDLIRIALRHLV